MGEGVKNSLKKGVKIVRKLLKDKKLYYKLPATILVEWDVPEKPSLRGF